MKSLEQTLTDTSERVGFAAQFLRLHRDVGKPVDQDYIPALVDILDGALKLLDAASDLRILELNSARR